MSRRIIVSAGNTEPEIRQRGYVYQKGRKKSDPWVSTQRAYGFFRMDVPGQTKQAEVRIPLGLCRDRVSAMFKLREAMRKAGVLDVEKSSRTHHCFNHIRGAGCLVARGSQSRAHRQYQDAEADARQYD